MKKKLLIISIFAIIAILPTRIFAQSYGLSEFKSNDEELVQTTIIGPNEEQYDVHYTVTQYTDETTHQPVANTGVIDLKSLYSTANGMKPFTMKITGNELDNEKSYTLSITKSAMNNMTTTIPYSGLELNTGAEIQITPTVGKVTVTLKETNQEELIDYTRSVCETAANPATCTDEGTVSFNTIIIIFSDMGSSNPSGPSNPTGPSNPSGPTIDQEEVAKMQALIETIAPNGVVELDSVDPSKTNAEEQLADSLLTAALLKKYDFGKYEVYVYPKSEYSPSESIELYYRNYANNTMASYSQEITIKYAEQDTSINSKLEEIRTKLNHDSQYYSQKYENNFNITDLESLNYYYNTQNATNKNAANYLIPSYSSKIHGLTDNLGFDFMFDPRAGGGSSLFYKPIIGPINILYNGIVVDNINPIGFTLTNILYIPSDTEKDRDSFISAAQKRIDEYFPGQNIEVSYEDDITNLTEDQYSWRYTDPQTHVSSFTPLFDLEDTNGEFYKIQIGDVTYLYFIVADSEKMNTPIVKTVDMNTNIKIESDSYDVPLDSRINVRKLDKNSEEYKELAKKIKILDDMSFDIDLLSSSLDTKIETLANGNFKVYIPVDEKTAKKTLVAAYIKEDGTIEEHEITIENGYAVFETNHFSTYSIVDKSNNPETGDKILKYTIILGISILGITGLTIYTKKNKKNK